MREHENVGEWMGHLTLKLNECNCKAGDRRLKEQFINCKSDEEMMTEKIRDLTAFKEINNHK